MEEQSGGSDHRRVVLDICRAALIVALALLAAMVLIERFGPEFVTDPATWQTNATWLIAALSVALLASDVLLPVPSSLVLIANGAVFGVVVGSAVSCVGLLGGSAIGYWLGGRGSQVTAQRLGVDGVAWLGTSVERHGMWVVGASRGVPLAAEMTAVAAGAIGMRQESYFIAAAIGAGAASIPLAMLGAGVLPGTSAIVIVVAASCVGIALWLRDRRSMGALSPSAPNESGA